MPTIDAAELEGLCTTILGAAGVSSAAAHSVAAHLVENDLRGIESHGCSRIPSYLRLIAERTISPKAEPTCEAVVGAHVLKVDGRRGFGIPAMERAIEPQIALRLRSRRRRSDRCCRMTTPSWSS